MVEYLRDNEYNEGKRRNIMFKQLAEVMKDTEIKRCMSILVEASCITATVRNVEENSIEVEFVVMGDREKKVHKIVLLSDSVVELTDGIPFRHEGKYLYKQYLIAKGYSEYWKGNFFVDEA